MEEVIKIEGKHALEGTVRISGSKNATVALIPAAILANGPVTICGVPEISDVQSLSVLLRDLGVLVDIRSSDTIVIDPTSMENRPLVQDAIISWEHCWANTAMWKLKCREAAIWDPDRLICI